MNFTHRGFFLRPIVGHFAHSGLLPIEAFVVIHCDLVWSNRWSFFIDPFMIFLLMRPIVAPSFRPVEVIFRPTVVLFETQSGQFPTQSGQFSKRPKVVNSQKDPKGQFLSLAFSLVFFFIPEFFFPSLHSQTHYPSFFTLKLWCILWERWNDHCSGDEWDEVLVDWYMMMLLWQAVMVFAL